MTAQFYRRQLERILVLANGTRTGSASELLQLIEAIAATALELKEDK